MLRRLDVIHRLLREPCPVDVSSLPHDGRGFGCAACGRTVVDVTKLTLDEVVELRRRQRSQASRICSAYTLDREDRVVLRAAPSSSALIAVAVGVLLAACDDGKVESAAAARAPGLAASIESTALRVRTLTPLPVAPSRAIDDPTPARAAPFLGRAPKDAPSAGPPCGPAHAPGAKRTGHAPPSDTRTLAGY